MSARDVDVTDGELLKPLVVLSLPIVLSQMRQVGGFTVAGTVLVAQNKGAGNDDRVDYAAGQTIRG